MPEAAHPIAEVTSAHLQINRPDGSAFGYDAPAGSGPPERAAMPATGSVPGLESELALYLPHLDRMSTQLRQTSAQIEEAVVDVCRNFEGISSRATATVSRAAGMLGRESESGPGSRSFESLIQTCGQTLASIVSTIAEAGEISRRAVERIHQMDQASLQIAQALARLEDIAKGNKMLALNARIEASHAGSHGPGFAAVAVELASQTARSREVTAEVSDLAGNLRSLAQSTLRDLQRMQEQDRERVEQCTRQAGQSLDDLRAAHAEMEAMLSGMTRDGQLLARDIGLAVRGMQFQDRTAQRIAHVVEDIETLRARLAARLNGEPGPAGSGPENDLGFSSYTMLEEREVAGIAQAESAGGDIELF